MEMLFAFVLFQPKTFKLKVCVLHFVRLLLATVSLIRRATIERCIRLKFADLKESNPESVAIKKSKLFFVIHPTAFSRMANVAKSKEFSNFRCISVLNLSDVLSEIGVRSK